MCYLKDGVRINAVSAFLEEVLTYKPNFRRLEIINSLIKVNDKLGKLEKSIELYD